MKKELTPEDGRKALLHHVVEKAIALKDKYGHRIDFPTLKRLLQDRDFVRYPTRLEFSTRPIERGLFAVTSPVSSHDPSQGYTIYVHEYFKKKLDVVPALVLYHLVTVNYGDIATSEEAELFGATVLGLGKEAYYRLLCSLADQIS